MSNSNGRLDGCFNGVNNGLVSSSLVGNANGLYTNEANVLNKFRVFEFICDTRNTSTGSSSASQVKLPLTSVGTYNFTVDWGDGSPKQTIRVWNQSETTHTYYYSGVYTIKIEGVIYGWSYNSTGDRNKILSVERWGGLRLASFTGSSVTNYFDGCLNLDLKGVKDCLNTENLTSFNGAFGNSTDAIAGSVLTNVNRINEWDTSNITTMFLMFGYATNFNEDLYFDTSKVNSMQQTFLQAPAFNGYVNSWNTSACTTMYQMFFGATAFNQVVDGWDTMGVTDMSQMFMSATNFNNGLPSGQTGTLNWNTSACTNISNMFSNTIAFNQNINSWDVSKVTNMGGVFGLTTSFNQPLSGWNTSACTTMQNMFNGALVFNQNLNSWDTSKVTAMNGTFGGAGGTGAFNNGLAAGVSGVMSWNTSACTTFDNIFSNAAAFNQNINSWDVSKVTIMSYAFSNTALFNQPLSSWNMSACTTMQNMFSSAAKFNQNINSWDVSKVTNMNQMFSLAGDFNNGLAAGVSGVMSWNTSSLISMNSIFSSAAKFNQNINSWDVSKVTNMGAAFQAANSFNQPLSGWNTSAATDMNNMFLNNTAFNQNIGNWNVSRVTNFTGFMGGKTPATFSSANLDAIYNGWINNPLNTGLTITFGTAKHTSASVEGKRLLTGTTSAVTITNAVNNGSGLIRVTTSPAHARTTNNKVFISGVTGTVEANGLWPVTVISTTQVDLQGSTFTNAYVSGGTMRTGYGWSITDGGI